MRIDTGIEGVARVLGKVRALSAKIFAQEYTCTCVLYIAIKAGEGNNGKNGDFPCDFSPDSGYTCRARVVPTGLGADGRSHQDFGKTT